MGKTIKLLLAEDHEIMREALGSLLESHPEFEVVAEARTGREVQGMVSASDPDVVVMDVNLPELSGIEATRRLRETNPFVRIIGLSMHENGRMISEMLEAGASGYLPKTSAARELVDAIRAVMSGDIYISSAVQNKVEASRNEFVARNGMCSDLSDREREVLQLLAEGFSTKEVAEQLKLQLSTVHTHRQHLMKKINARGVADLVRYAIRSGITLSEI